MAGLKICRICLRTQCKVYQYDRFNLKLYYEEIMASKINDKDGLPHYFCFECAAMLRKFRKFKEKCFVGQNLLKEIQFTEGISYKSISKTNRLILQSPIDIITVTKRVKTYNVIEESLTKLNDSDSESDCIKEEDETEDKSNEMELQYVSEDSMTYPGDNCDPETDHLDPDTGNLDLDTGNLDLDTGNLDLDTGNLHPDNDNLDSDTVKFDPVTADDLKSNVKEEEKPKVIKDLLEEFDSKNKKPKRSKTENPRVFVAIKKKAMKAKKEDKKINESDNFPEEYGLKKQNPAFAKKKRRFLDMNHWRQSTLTEEAAMKEFRSKGDDPKYIAAEYKCTDCFKWFREADILKRHRQLRHNESLGTLECRFCHMRFKWDCHLRKHLRSHFNKYECLRCDLICPLESTAFIHEEFHNGVIRTCVHCGEEFKHSSTYYTHLRTHRSEHICKTCGASFVSPLGLHIHKKAKHFNNEVEIQDDDEEVSTFCEKCKIRFETKKAYEEHLFHSAMHTEGIEDDIEDDISAAMEDSKDSQSKVTHGVKGRKVDDVLLTLKRKRKRMPKITHRKPTTCHQCGKHFNTQKDCMKHHLSEHRGTSFFPATERQICEICGISLAPGSVAMHINTHTREKLHPCDTCGRAFNTNISLKRHQVTHTGEKKFGCPLCDKRFTQSNSMKLHYRTFHLKQPYPKRNRRKKDDLPEPLDHQEDSSDDSDAIETSRMRKAVRVPENNGLHYLTLS